MPKSNISVTPATQGYIPTPIYSLLAAENTDGETNGNRDYSSDVTDFVYDAAVDCRITRLIVLIGDTGAVGVANYGALSALTNGLLVGVKRSGTTILDLLDGIPIKKNVDWQRYSFDLVINDKGAGNAGWVGCRWTFEKSGFPLRLRANDKFFITLRDDLDGLTEHYFTVQGFLEQS